MAAAVVEGLYARRGVHDDGRLVEYRVRDIVAYFGDLLLAACHLPDARPEVLLLELEERLVEVALLRDALGMRDLERNVPEGSANPIRPYWSIPIRHLT